MILLSASKVCLWVQRDGSIWSFLTWTRSHLALHWHPETSREVVEETLLILQESQYYSLLELVDAVPRWMFSVPDLLQEVWFVHLRLENFYILFRKYYFLCIESFWADFWCVHRLQLFYVCDQYVILPNFPRVQSVSEEQSRWDFLSKLMDSWLVFRRDRVILNQWTKRNDRSFKWLPKTSLIRGFAIRWEICNISQIGVAFHGICPPIFIQTWLQQYGRSAFFYSAHCSFSNPICFRSVWCWRAMIPGKIFTGFAEFQGIVSVNELLVSFLAPRTFASSFVFPAKFLFCTETTGSIGWPRPAPRLHIDDCFEIHNFHWEFCDLLLSSHQNFLHEVRLRHCVFCTGPMWYWSFYRSRNFGLWGNEYKHCAYPHVSWIWALKMVHEKNWRVSLCVQELYHPQDSLWILATTPGFQNLRDLNRQTTRFTVLSRSHTKHTGFDYRKWFFFGPPFLSSLRHDTLLCVPKKMTASNIEKFMMLNKRRRWSHSSRLKLPLINMSASWFLVSANLIWILGVQIDPVKQRRTRLCGSGHDVCLWWSSWSPLRCLRK